MAGSDKVNAAHDEHHPHNHAHEAALTGALALANLFSHCVEAFGLINPSHKWDRDEQLLLVRLGIQQARLLIWGDGVGISSPPLSVTDRAIPRHPSSAYPDLKEPTFFGPRDVRLDEPDTRVLVERALGAIVDRAANATREEMMERYGLKPPKRTAAIEHQPALDMSRLEAFREKYELLQEVAETYANVSARRSNSIVQTTWMIADPARFSNFINLTREKVDFLIATLDVKDRVDRGMRMDIRALGWHLTDDRTRSAQDASKLRLMQEACKDEYPEYAAATKEALDNIGREARENMAAMYSNPYASRPAITRAPATAPAAVPDANGEAAATTTTTAAIVHDKHKRPGLFGLFKSRGSKTRDNDPKNVRRNSASSALPSDPPRSQSDSGPATASTLPTSDTNAGDLEPIRSKSVGDILHPEHAGLEEAIRRTRLETLEQVHTQATVKDEPLVHTELVSAEVSRHDQYHGIARTETKDLRQGLGEENGA